ncbi:MAG: hypothetical protein UU48_C0006G0049 [Candidatus Uhrbacteria bacterium GW2011_GWF2_41_16]|uniref:Polymerase nucleotidyl transferase domain-containing protein n=2 Tax=Candidatus Uhriibacteriota TaxID=1752732 RepID=A0A0G0VAS6_9BACT|nr:MAG: hypothetical protein UU35_C0007G0084 [Candidatus Uhrbacteria bacterium GW2011_GWC2_41_11]KKR98009.1 MAG: hypothetical protein UU48_C0006G0049 [Candidatus Uhrbacteria bacterium GW2011_GWF2_41_16]HBO99567.1 hypothetical protein [Candidatus Uhrbacteria bacterium]
MSDKAKSVEFEFFGVKDPKKESTEQARKNIEGMGEDVIMGKISVLESAERMGALVRDSLKHIADEFATRLHIDPSELPFSLFIFGSPARDLMLPGSDIDIGLIFKDDCPVYIKEELKQKIRALPFEVDIAKWHSLDAVKKENCPHMIEYTNAIEARFIVGNNDIAEKHRDLIEKQDSRQDKERRFITVYNLFHKYNYPTKKTKFGQDLKYDFGATRDIIFLDWFLAIEKEKASISQEKPAAFVCLDTLLQDGVVSPEEQKRVQNAIELILLTKITLWRENEKTKDEHLLYLSDSSLEHCYHVIEGTLKKQGIKSLDEFMYVYANAKASIHELVEKLYKNVASRHQESVDLWEMAKAKTSLDEDVLDALKNPGWNELVPFAVRSTSPEILHYIVKRFSNTPGLEYILRIISENFYITDEIKKDLLVSKLDKKFKAKFEEDFKY